MKSNRLLLILQNSFKSLFLIFRSRSISSLVTFLTLMNMSYAEPYYICGPDEDGCYDEITEYCTCIPYNEREENKPYCLTDFRCIPLSQKPDCHPFSTFKNQGDCLATLYQSISTPPCKITTYAFCLENNSDICDPDGNPYTCHKNHH